MLKVHSSYRGVPKNFRIFIWLVRYYVASGKAYYGFAMKYRRFHELIMSQCTAARTIR